MNDLPPDKTTVEADSKNIFNIYFFLLDKKFFKLTEKKMKTISLKKFEKNKKSIEFVVNNAWNFRFVLDLHKCISILPKLKLMAKIPV